jgi:predicted histone-like DNA-binding protein
MAIKYSVQQKTQAGVKGGGHRKYYASVVNAGEITIDDMVRDIEKYTALSELDIRCIVTALQTVIQEKLTSSLVVRLEQLGSFYPALSSDGKDTEEEINENCVRKVGINYRPTMQIIQAMEDAGFEKVMGKTRMHKEKKEKNRKNKS